MKKCTHIDSASLFMIDEYVNLFPFGSLFTQMDQKHMCSSSQVHKYNQPFYMFSKNI